MARWYGPPVIACRNMGVNVRFHVSNTFFVFTCLGEHGWRFKCTHTMHSLRCVLAVVNVARKPHSFLRYNGHRDRINLVLLRSYFRGGGTFVWIQASPALLASTSGYWQLLGSCFGSPANGL